MSTLPKISIITPSFNQGRFIEKAIRSVIEQDYPNLEYIIIDEGSTDESIEIIRKYERHLAYWVSEPDRGQSHAINKGFEKATGEIFGWINSNDWYHPGALQAVTEAFAANPDAGVVVGAGEMYSEEFQSTQTINPFPVTLQSLYGALDRSFIQPSCFFRDTTWRDCGPLDEDLPQIMDLDLWLKFARKYRFALTNANLATTRFCLSANTTTIAPQLLVDACLVTMRHGGIKEGRQRLLQELIEIRQNLTDLTLFDKRNKYLVCENIRLKQSIRLYEEQISAMQQSIAALHNSICWRVTTPIRWLGNLSIAQQPEKQAQPEASHYNVRTQRTFTSLLLADIQNREGARSVYIDIIIPVYNAYDMVVPCITSVLSNSSYCRVIIIDDCSTDRRIVEFIDSIQDLPEQEVSVIKVRNEVNLGFLKTVNKAFALTKHNVVILNSDTEVPGNWLDRLIEPFNESEDIATVIPLSNASTIYSFPYADIDNRLYLNMTTDTLDRYFFGYLPPEPMDIPTGIGFCMAINRKVLEKIGLFDEKAFGRGYGEEVDFCMRAADAGFRNVLIPNLFIYHKHGGSFNTSERNRLKEQNNYILLQKHPGFTAAVENFLLTDPLSSIRSYMKIIIHFMEEKSGSSILLFDCNYDRGLSQYSRDLVSFMRFKGHRVITLQHSYASRLFHLTVDVGSELIEEEVDYSPGIATLIKHIVHKLAIDSIVVNQLVSWPDTLAVTGAVKDAGVPYTVLLHDYFMVCPNWTLFDFRESFCGIPDDGEVCAHCLETLETVDIPITHHIDTKRIEPWRINLEAYLCGASQVVCFSDASEQILHKAYPSLSNLVVSENFIPDCHLFRWEKRTYKPGKQLTIAVIGDLTLPKGGGLIDQLMLSTGFRNLPVRIVAIGDINPKPQYGNQNEGPAKFILHGSYRREVLGYLLESYDTSIIIMPSLWPETHCFMASEALLLGYPVIACNIGAQAEIIRRYDTGWVVDLPYVDGFVTVISQILSFPNLVEEKSLNSRGYEPVSLERHGSIILLGL